MKQIFIGGMNVTGYSPKCYMRDIRISNIARSQAYAVQATEDLLGI